MEVSAANSPGKTKAKGGRFIRIAVMVSGCP
jgi:hypothetical protein